ncbi:MAG: hypothetical protein ACD_19C00114G0003 [uncultured bacterium]|nr:MAG: hypothetical protein ACD_19C00114G0003 [uncultured bacterium]
MNFPYLKVLDFLQHKKRERILPWIRFGVFNSKNKNNIIYPIGLVDSGSELSFMNNEIGEALGLDIKSGKQVEVAGVGGGKLTVYLHKLNLVIEDPNSEEEAIVFEDVIGFTNVSFSATMPQQTAILGTMGFFRNLDVMFSYPNYIGIINKTNKVSN